MRREGLVSSELGRKETYGSGTGISVDGGKRPSQNCAHILHLLLLLQEQPKFFDKSRGREGQGTATPSCQQQLCIWQWLVCHWNCYHRFRFRLPPWRTEL